MGVDVVWILVGSGVTVGIGEMLILPVSGVGLIGGVSAGLSARYTIS